MRNGKLENTAKVKERKLKKRKKEKNKNKATNK